MVKSVNKVHYYDFGSFRLDLLNRELLKNGVHVSITQKSFELLQFLIENRGRGLRKNEILNSIWTESYVEEANLAQHIYMIRKVLKDNGNTEKYIETIPKYGYRFNGEVFESIGEETPLQRAIISTSATDVKVENEIAQQETNHEVDYVEESVSQTSPSNKTSSDFNYSRIAVFGGISVVILAAFAFYFFRKPNQTLNVSNIKSIAILPFNQIGDNSDKKLGLGLADTLISRLGNQNQTSISPTSTIIKFLEKGTDDSIEIGEKLGVDAVLTGTIQRDADNVRVNVQLINVRKKIPLWSDKFDAKFSNIFALQDTVSEQVAAKLSLKLSDPSKASINNRYTENIEAYQAYTMGLFHWAKRTETNLAKAISNLEKAIAKDPKFASAYAYLADSYSLVAYSQMALIPKDEAISKAQEMAQRALALDPNSSEAITVLGFVAHLKRKPEESIDLYKRAISLKPNNATAHLRLAWMLSTAEGLDAALSQMRLAQKADPQSRVINTNLTRLLRLNRQPDEALTFCKRAIEIDSSVAASKLLMAELYEQKKMFGEATKKLDDLIKQDPDDDDYRLILGRIKAKQGDKKSAKSILKRVTQNGKKRSFEAATVHLYLGDKGKALSILSDSHEDTQIYYIHMKYDHNLDPLRNSPEFDAILAKSKKRFHAANG